MIMFVKFWDFCCHVVMDSLKMAPLGQNMLEIQWNVGVSESYCAHLVYFSDIKYAEQKHSITSWYLEYSLYLG